MTRTELIDQIDALRKLGEPNWDSYGADPVSAYATESAKQFVEAIWGQLGPRIRLAIGPRPDGGISVLVRGAGEIKVEVLFPATSQMPPSYLLMRPGTVKDKGQIYDVEDFTRTVLPLVS